MKVDTVKNYISQIERMNQPNEFYTALLIYDILGPEMAKSPDLAKIIEKVEGIHMDYDSIYNPSMRDEIRDAEFDDSEIEPNEPSEEEIDVKPINKEPEEEVEGEINKADLK